MSIRVMVAAFAISPKVGLTLWTMRFLNVLLVDRMCDIPSVVLCGCRWLRLCYDLSPVKPSGDLSLVPLKFSRVVLGCSYMP